MASTDTNAAAGGLAVPRRGPLHLTLRSWWGALRRAITRFREDKLTDWAAALTYYAVLAIFPGLIALVATLGLLGQHPQTTNAILDIIDEVGPASAVDTFRSPIEGVIRSKGGAGALLGVGLIAALWSASGYIGAFTRASNVIYEVREGRPFWKLRPLQVLLTVVCVLLVALLAIALVLTGDLARAVGHQIGVEDEAVQIWSIAKWPLLLLAVLLWLLASAGFATYVANFGSYNKTYGALGAVVVFLVWLWISNLALLFGAEFNAELERSKELEEGTPREQTLALEPRSPSAD